MDLIKFSHQSGAQRVEKELDVTQAGTVIMNAVSTSRWTGPSAAVVKGAN